MVRDLPDLLPEKSTKLATADNAGQKSKETGKAAQERVMAMMRQKQRNFATSIDQSEATRTEAKMDEECIICRCDDADGQNNGPLGYLGHVQRSRVAQMRAVFEADDSNNPLFFLLLLVLFVSFLYFCQRKKEHRQQRATSNNTNIMGEAVFRCGGRQFVVAFAWSSGRQLLLADGFVADSLLLWVTVLLPIACCCCCAERWRQSACCCCNK
jgi:hypothetical protein